ncbi:acyl-[acyl-carrier-protein]--UDP-N-acetylglucosamine O-acyltransferase [Prosthecobacter fusiformis]|uniref:Acyl-[acyl-carrier-protein]--UDP-N-acetylglucosamine O-acyltransferase n=1 Tax=Prosthecobacter fusiformis TaxID=48464 RepID=A0A4R7S3H5_9BACT|nr:acyl-ACP--UDP-N-acetylglucosamine O-acyltransferase [Prosthecobacter fusiformis]TDU72942.1 acyl-[acyl-carrier-protein]--UDP-N-acetylglucosamine O-acyltransferase [Prosthecobacter fusiformis]
MIHPTALIHPSAQIDSTAEIGPYVIVDGPAEIGPGCRLEAHSQIVGQVKMGAGTVIGRAAIIGGDPQDLGFKTETESGVILGEANVIREHVTIHRGSKPGSFTRIGDGNFIMASAHLAHDVVLGNKNILANACLLAGHITVGSHTFIGGGAVFHQFIRIGDYCVIQGNGGFGKDIPHFCAAHRINRLMGLNVIGLRRQGFSSEQRASIKQMFHLLFSSGRNLSQAVAAAREKEWSEPAQRLLDFVATPSKRGICALQGGREGED